MFLALLEGESYWAKDLFSIYKTNNQLLFVLLKYSLNIKLSSYQMDFDSLALFVFISTGTISTEKIETPALALGC